MSAAVKKVINLNTQPFLKGAPLKKLHVKMDELYDCILDWRTMDEFSFLFRNVRSVQKQASAQLPGTGEVCPFGTNLGFHLDATLSIQTQSAASLIRTRFMECIPLEFWVKLDKTQMKQVLDSTAIRRVKCAIARRETFAYGWKKHKAVFSAPFHAFGTDYPTCTLCTYEIPWCRFSHISRHPPCKVVSDVGLNAAQIDVQLASLCTQISALHVILEMLT